MRIANVLGVRITLNPLFFVLIGLSIAAGMVGETLVIFAAVLFHEISHAVVAAGFGLKVIEISLTPLGGIARVEGLLEADPTAEGVIAVVGPVNNLLVAGVALVLARLGFIGRSFAGFFIEANLAIGLANLVPVVPLDGGRILRAYLASRIGFRRGTQVACAAGKAVACIVFALGLAGMALRLSNITLPVLSVFVFWECQKELAASGYAFIRYLAIKRQELAKLGVVHVEHLAAGPETTVQSLVRRMIPRKYHIVTVMGPGRKMIGEVTEDDIISALLESGPGVRLRDIVDRGT